MRIILAIMAVFVVAAVAVLFTVGWRPSVPLWCFAAIFAVILRLSVQDEDGDLMP